MQQSQKPGAAVPSATAVPQTQEIPEVRTPEEYYGKETRTRQTAGENEDGGPRIDNEPLDPALRGFFKLPGVNAYMKFGGFVADLFYPVHLGDPHGSVE